METEGCMYHRPFALLRLVNPVKGALSSTSVEEHRGKRSEPTSGCVSGVQFCGCSLELKVNAKDPVEFPRIPHSSKDVVSGGKSLSLPDDLPSLADRSYLPTPAAGLSLSKSAEVTVKLDPVLPWADEVARDVCATFRGGERD